MTTINADDFPKLAAPARWTLAATSVQHLEPLSKFSQVEVKKRHGIGPMKRSTSRLILGDDPPFRTDELNRDHFGQGVLLTPPEEKSR